MKVLYITTVPSPYKIRFFEELGKYINLTVIFERKSADYRDNDWFIYNHKNFRSIYLKGLTVRGNRVAPEIIRIIRNGHFDHIIVGVYSTLTQMLAQEYMIKKHIPYIISSDGGIIKTDNFIQTCIKKHFIGSASYWLSTGRVTDEYLEHYGAFSQGIYRYPFTSVNAVDVINEPIPLDEKRALRKKLGISEGNVVLSVGQLIKRKGMDILIQAAKDLKNADVYIVGGVPPQEYLDLCENNNINNVHFIGYKKENDLGDYYKASDVFVLATREDIWGLVINEAMARGVPVVTTNKCVAGMEMIDNRVTGSIISANDIRSLAHEVQYWIDTKETTDRRAIINKAKEYTIEKMATKHVEILAHIEKKVSE